MTYKKGYTSMISDVMHVSESEIAMIYPQYDVSWLVDRIDDLKSVLFDLGLDSNQNFTLQEVTQHRNRLGQVVTCGRFEGVERSDTGWLKSGYASQAARDKSKNSKLLDDLYRERGLTQDMQDAMERKDKYKEIEDEEGEE